MTESRHERFPVGTEVVATIGVRTHTVCNPDTLPPFCGDAPVIEPVTELLKARDRAVAITALGCLG